MKIQNEVNTATNKTIEKQPQTPSQTKNTQPSVWNIEPTDKNPKYSTTPTQYTEDKDGDGTIDYIEKVYQNGGYETLLIDDNADGKIDYIEESYSDKNHSIITMDKNADGKLDYTSAAKYDDYGRILRYDIDENGDGIADIIEISEYNDKNNLIKTTVYNGKGEATEIDSIEYDENGNTTLTIDKNIQNIPNLPESEKRSLYEQWKNK